VTPLAIPPGVFATLQGPAGQGLGWEAEAARQMAGKLALPHSFRYLTPSSGRVALWTSHELWVLLQLTCGIRSLERNACGDLLAAGGCGPSD